MLFRSKLVQWWDLVSVSRKFWVFEHGCWGGINLSSLERRDFMRAKRSITTFALFLILFCVAWATPAYVAEKSPYKIGVNLELTGPWGEVTKIVKMAMDMEVERMNGMGGIDGHPLELIYEDK